MIKSSLSSTILYVFLILNVLQFAKCENTNIDDWLKENNVNREKILLGMQKLRKALLEISPDLEISVTILRSCLQMTNCRFVCFNGRSTDIERDIQMAMDYAENSTICTILNEVQLYNYNFPNGTLPIGFLGNFSDKVVSLYIISSNISYVEPGALANGIFKQLYFEESQFKILQKSFFERISYHFELLSIVQHNTPVSEINNDFLYYVRYRIRSLTVQAGIPCLRNMTSGDLLNALTYVDFRHNNFSSGLEWDSMNDLSMVEQLNLAHCEIEHLPDYIFNNMWASLKYLNISHNKLITVSMDLFGWHELSLDLRIYANDNPWQCNCELQQNLTYLFQYQTNMRYYCTEPDEYKDWLVFDKRLCKSDGGEGESSETTTISYMSTITTTTTKRTSTTTSTSTSTTTSTTTQIPIWTTTPERPTTTTTTQGTTSTESIPETDTTTTIPETETLEIQCYKRDPEITYSLYNYTINLPTQNFITKEHSPYTIAITLNSTKDRVTEYELFWFNSTTSMHLEMTRHPKYFGLGCYFSVPMQSIVENLTPNVAYTFCLIGSDESYISPFSCKSAHVGGNIEIHYSSWKKRNVRATRISLLVFGIVFGVFGGILFVFLLLKNKPMLLKGNKRIVTPKGSNKEIVVLPKHKSVEELNYKEAKLARYNTKSTFNCHTPRRHSFESTVSSESYMIANLYETIPDYLTFENIQQQQQEPDSDDYFEIYDNGGTSVQQNLFQAPDMYDDAVHYAQIPLRSKRTSNDPLPELPQTSAMRPLPALPFISDVSVDINSIFNTYL